MQYTFLASTERIYWLKVRKRREKTPTVAVWPRSVDGPRSIPPADELVLCIVPAQFVSLTTMHSTGPRIVMTHDPANERTMEWGFVLVRNGTRRIWWRKLKKLSRIINVQVSSNIEREFRRNPSALWLRLLTFGKVKCISSMKFFRYSLQQVLP